MTVTPKRYRPLCGARCRTGAACRARVVWDFEHNRPRNGKCRMHGGLSTGPRTLAGRLRSLANLKQFREA
ncbi:MAG: HGGxSTG domain-containing protein [Alphaproteobacteria bacterium]|nr:HGGxSTG domain-containing protein [Alphaproteobacteria bacterium]